MSKRQRKNADADDTEWKGSSEEPESTPQTRSKRASPKKKQQKAERNEFDDDFDLSDDYEAPPKKKSSSTKKATPRTNTNKARSPAPKKPILDDDEFEDDFDDFDDEIEEFESQPKPSKKKSSKPKGRVYASNKRHKNDDEFDSDFFDEEEDSLEEQPVNWRLIPKTQQKHVGKSRIYSQSSPKKQSNEQTREFTNGTINQQQVEMNKNLVGKWSLVLTSPPIVQGQEAHMEVVSLDDVMGAGNAAGSQSYITCDNTQSPGYAIGWIYNFIRKTNTNSRSMIFETRWNLQGKKYVGVLQVCVERTEGGGFTINGTFAHGAPCDGQEVHEWDFEGVKQKEDI
jgi:hypothetical protein